MGDPQSAAAEAYRSLRTNIQFAALDQPLTTLLVASADGLVDKDAVANLAAAMAEAGDTVVLVDGDLRHPQQHERFGLANASGLGNWLETGTPAAPQRTEIGGLRVLTAGSTTASPMALLSQNRLVDVLSALAAEADYVLIDAPPLLAVTDGALWASQCDGVLLLLRAGRTKRDHAQRAKAVLEKARAHVVGAVLIDAERDAVVEGYA